MNKKKDSLTDFDFLDDITNKFSSSDESENLPIEKENKSKKGRGRPSGYFVKDLEKEPTKNISVFESTHLELYDLVYHISKINMTQNKRKVTLLGIATKAISIGVKELKKEYGLD